MAEPTIIPTNAFAERNNIKGEIREAQAYQINKGITATDSTTATEIQGYARTGRYSIVKRPTTLRKASFMQEATIVFLLKLFTQTITI